MLFIKSPILFFAIVLIGIAVVIWLANWKEKQDNVFDVFDRNWTVLGAVLVFVAVLFVYLLGYNFGIGAF